MTETGEARRRAIGAAKLIAAAAAVGGTLLGASAVSRRLFERPRRTAIPARTTPSNPIVAPAPADPSFRLASARGKIEAYRQGRWTPIQVGEQLALQDVVLTGPSARAVIRRGANTEIEIHEKVEVRLDRFTDDSTTLDLIRGKVEGGVARPGETLEIRAGATRSSNEGVARFVISRDARGAVGAAAKVGTALFSAAGQQVHLSEGTESFAAPGKPPSEPETIPEEVLLSVIWPAARGEERAQVKGKVRPSSSVKVNGVDTAVRADGSFTASLALREGANKVEIQAEDLSGLTKKVSSVLERRSKGPTLETEPEALWKR